MWKSRFAVAACIVAGFLASSALSLPLDKEIARLAPASRPTTAQAENSIRQQKEWERLSDEAWQRIQPELKDWAAKGKPYITWVTHPDDLPQAEIPAFPGAQGGGAFTFGGRGGRVFVIKTLDDSGPGSLREACEAAGPRIVVFNVAGIIHLKRPLDIRAPYITIAGQTAP